MKNRNLYSGDNLEILRNKITNKHSKLIKII